MGKTNLQELDYLENLFIPYTDFRIQEITENIRAGEMAILVLVHCYNKMVDLHHNLTGGGYTSSHMISHPHPT